MEPDTLSRMGSNVTVYPTPDGMQVSGQHLYYYCTSWAVAEDEIYTHFVPILSNDSTPAGATWMLTYEFGFARDLEYLWQYEDLFVAKFASGSTTYTYKFYHTYSKSQHWKIKAKIIKSRIGECERCGKDRRLVLHHRTYDSIPFERSADLEVLCTGCHWRIDHSFDAWSYKEQISLMGSGRYVDETYLRCEHLSQLNKWPTGEEDGPRLVLSVKERGQYDGHWVPVAPQPESETAR